MENAVEHAFLSLFPSTMISLSLESDLGSVNLSSAYPPRNGDHQATIHFSYHSPFASLRQRLGNHILFSIPIPSSQSWWAHSHNDIYMELLLSNPCPICSEFLHICPLSYNSLLTALTLLLFERRIKLYKRCIRKISLLVVFTVNWNKRRVKAKKSVRKLPK